MRSVVFLAVVLSLPVLASADELWVVRGQTAPQCPGYTNLWRADALIFADSTLTGDVHVLDVSNGGTAQQASFPLSPGRAVSVGLSARDHADSVVWMTHLDVPSGSMVDARLTYLVEECRGIPLPLEPFTKVPMPTFHSLVPAGKPQVHMGSDLGAQSVRVNVGIYNAGFVSAVAMIVIRRPNCEVAPVTMSLSVPARTLVQTSLSPPIACSRGPMFPGSFTLTDVTVSEPSLSYVVALSNVELPMATIGFATTAQ